MAREWGISYIEVSALKRQHVDDAFIDVLRQAIRLERVSDPSTKFNSHLRVVLNILPCISGIQATSRTVLRRGTYQET